ncbi:MAG TPA: cupredoxin domain-containing protein [Nitrospirales bacterium]|nr:cupredoxin domain-containing protein [Nitrospirales bacterium]
MMACRTLLHGAVAFLIASTAACEPSVTEVTLMMEEFRFVPSQITVPAGTPLRLHVQNRGHEPHEFQFPRVFSDAIRIEPGRTAELLITPRPGIQAFRCRIRGHGGMEGTLIASS